MKDMHTGHVEYKKEFTKEDVRKVFGAVEVIGNATVITPATAEPLADVPLPVLPKRTPMEIMQDSYAAGKELARRKHGVKPTTIMSDEDVSTA